MRRSGLDGHTQAHRTKAKEEETKKSALTWEATKAEALLPAASLSPLCGKRRRLGRKLVLKSVFFPPTLCVPLCLSRKLPALSRGVWCCFFFLLCCVASVPFQKLPSGGWCCFFFFLPRCVALVAFLEASFLIRRSFVLDGSDQRNKQSDVSWKKKMTWMTSQIGWLHPFNIY
jgi:hypothetical protein